MKKNNGKNEKKKIGAELIWATAQLYCDLVLWVEIVFQEKGLNGLWVYCNKPRCIVTERELGWKIVLQLGVQVG